MEKIIKLLLERNKYLAKFVALNNAELEKITKGNFDNINSFYETRESLLELIKNIEVMVEKLCQYMTDAHSVGASTKRQVSDLLKERDQFVNQILVQDLEILSCIDQAKNLIIQELQQVRKNKKVIGSYKSGAKTALVDEEA